MSNETEQRSTSAEIKKQIEEATKAAKEGQLPLTGQVANEINANVSTPEPELKAASKPDPITPAAERADGGSKALPSDLEEWRKKKGIDWTTEESVLSALRKSDQAFHAKRQADKAREAAPPPYAPPPPPAYQQPVPPQNGNGVPAYQQPQDPRHIIEGLARDFNMTPEDVDRLAKFNHFQFQAMLAQQRQLDQERWAQLERENQKNSVFRELSSDPVFRRPDVAMEFHAVLDQMQETDPTSFEQDPSAYKRAFDRALQNIARRNLEGQPLQEGVPPGSRVVSPPTTPPRPLGRTSAGGAYENENAIDPQQFAKLSLKEKSEVLERMGLRPGI